MSIWPSPYRWHQRGDCNTTLYTPYPGHPLYGIEAKDVSAERKKVCVYVLKGVSRVGYVHVCIPLPQHSLGGGGSMGMGMSFSACCVTTLMLRNRYRKAVAAGRIRKIEARIRVSGHTDKLAMSLKLARLQEKSLFEAAKFYSHVLNSWHRCKDAVLPPACPLAEAAHASIMQLDAKILECFADAVEKHRAVLVIKRRHMALDDRLVSGEGGYILLAREIRNNYINRCDLLQRSPDE